MPNLNPNLVLVAIVVLVLLAGGLIGLDFVIDGSLADVTVRAGLVTAFVAPTIAALAALLVAGRASSRASDAVDQVGGHTEQLEAAESRIAYLETRERARSGWRPPIRTEESK